MASRDGRGKSFICAIPGIGTNQILIDLGQQWFSRFFMIFMLRDAFAPTAHALLETDQYLPFATKRLHHHDGGARGDDPGTMER